MEQGKIPSCKDSRPDRRTKLREVWQLAPRPNLAQGQSTVRTPSALKPRNNYFKVDYKQSGVSPHRNAQRP